VAFNQTSLDEIGKKWLLNTMKVFNDACNEIAQTCFEQKSASKFSIQKLVYYQIKEKYNLSAQLVIRAIAKTCEAYKLNKKIKPKFKKYGSITYDQRILSFKGLTKVSLWTIEGRKTFDIFIRDYFKSRTNNIQGQVDLVYQNGQFYLYATYDLPECDEIKVNEFLGIDLGEVNIAVDSTNEIFSNAKVEKVRLKRQKQRQQCQKKNTKASKRKLKKVSGKERRFRTNENHRISKILVKKAKDTNLGIALEDLSGITKRTTVRKSQRAKRHSWSFYQLRQFITYKAKLCGVPVILVDPRNTSRTCSSCGYCSKNNRKTQSEFCCKSCGYEENADYNAAKNIAAKAVSISLMSSAKELLEVA